MKFRLLLATATLLLITPFIQAQNNCNSMIFDKAGVITNPSVIANAARPLISQGADVRIVTVDSIGRYGSSLSDVETSLEQKCPNLTTNGVRKANLFVIMVAPNDRQKNIFLGSYYSGAFDVTSTYSQLANSYFKNRQWEAGIANTLNGTGARASAYRQRVIVAQQQRAVPVVPQQRVYTTTPAYTAPVTNYPTQNADSGMSGVAIFFIVLLILGVIAAVLYFIFRDSTSTTTTYTSDAGFQPSSSSSSYRQRSYAAQAPSHTTVINNTSNNDGLLTGVLLGEAMSRPAVQPVYVAPSPVYVDPSPSYIPAPAPVVDAPDSTWVDDTPTQQADSQDTSFEAPSEPSYDPPSYDPPSSDFGGSSNNDSGF